MARAVIFGCEGGTLSAAEKAFFADADPWGFILFARNIDTAEQVRALCKDLRDIVGRDAPILIDQEGGRVQRLLPPLSREWLPPLDQFEQVAPADRRRAMVLRARIIADDLMQLGIDVNCAPMLDLPQDYSHEIIRNRCLAFVPDDVAEMGRAQAEGFLAGGVLPIIKHFPGHGKTPLDSHADLPVVDVPLEQLQAEDFVPFKRLADLPMAMTAHIVYPAIDPDNCATFSADVVSVMRGEIGFGGLIMTDDLSMHALSGPFAARVAKALGAGCDMILHCNGQMDEMTQIAAAVPALEGDAKLRAGAALAERHAPDNFDRTAAEAEFDRLIGAFAHAG